MDIVITTVLKPSTTVQAQALELAAKLGTTATIRGAKSIATIKQECGVSHVMVVTNDGPIIYSPIGEYFFHLSMAELRIKNLRNGKHDHMITAMGLNPGMNVLDCTLGLASDAIVASYVTGSTGAVVGLESSAILATITSVGLQQFVCDEPTLTNALRRIKVIQIDSHCYLASLPERSFDIVYFDPMFRAPLKRSSNLNAIRDLADPRPLCTETIKEACRVAKTRVVLKEANGSKEFERLGIKRFYGGKYSRVAYGVIEIGGLMVWNA